MFDFNFESAESLTNKNIQLADLKVLGNNNIRIGDEAVLKLGLKTGKKVLILRDKNGNFAIAGVDPESTEGREIKKNNGFSSKTIATLLGGQYSEYALEGDGMEHPITGDVYYGLVETVNGTEERAKFKVEEKEIEETLQEQASEPVEEPVLPQDTYNGEVE